MNITRHCYWHRGIVQQRPMIYSSCFTSVITFKNFIKDNWPSLDNTNVISLQDRNHIKEHIVELMTPSPEHIQEQLSEAITVIEQCDFSHQWPSLLEPMIRQFQQQQSRNSFQPINGMFKTVHSLLERYRYDQKFDELWLEIKLVLEQFAPLFTQLFQVRTVVVLSNEMCKFALR
jgi:exportin-2 (importin alpha re-exporter)